MQLIKNFKELWQYRELFYFITLRDIKIRYKQALFGIIWALVSPITLALVFWIVFGIFLKIQTGPTPYLLLVFSKLTFWNFFSQSLTISTTSFTSNANLISKSAFPREIIVISAVFTKILDLMASLVVLFVLMFLYGSEFSLTALWILPLLIITFLLILGLGFIFSSLNVYFRDVSAFLPLLLTVWLFVTPVIYSLESLPVFYQRILILNPLTGIVEGLKKSLLNSQNPQLESLLLSLIFSAVVFILGYVFFKKLEKGFADVI